MALSAHCMLPEGAGNRPAFMLLYNSVGEMPMIKCDIRDDHRLILKKKKVRLFIKESVSCLLTSLVRPEDKQLDTEWEEDTGRGSS